MKGPWEGPWEGFPWLRVGVIALFCGFLNWKFIGPFQGILAAVLYGGFRGIFYCRGWYR